MADRARLESWKEIAACLGRSIKTCQRWEQEFDLPVHRLAGAPRSRVSALREELDNWMRDKLRLAEASESVRSLAVLPLRNLTGDPSQDYFVEGLTEAIITALGRAPNLRVISHQSTRQFRATERSIPEIAGILRVDALLEGSVLRAGDRYRITANLVQASPERHLWAHESEQDRARLASYPHEIALAIARRIGAVFPPGEGGFSVQPKVAGHEAYDQYLRGLSSLKRSYVQVDIERALRHFEQAVGADPAFAAAWAQVAWCHGQLGFHSFVPPRDAFRKQSEAAGKALALDPGLAESHTMTGFHAFAAEWDWGRAERHLKKALELNPSSLWANTYGAWLATCLDRHTEADEFRARLLSIDPLDPENHWTLGWGYFWASRHRDAIATFSRLLEQAPDDHWLRMARGVNFAFENRREEALRDCGLARAGIPIGLDLAFDMFLACTSAKSGRQDQARDTLAQWDEIAKERPLDPITYSAIYFCLGDDANGLACLERGFEERRPWMVFMKTAPFYGPVRENPRFKALVKKMRFPAD
jgi:TolB-like protein/Tfp pilus assembly protein PilF